MQMRPRTRTPFVAALAGSLCALLGSCAQSTTTRHPVGALAAAVIRPLPAVSTWDVLEGDTVIGRVIRFEQSPGRSPSRVDDEFLYVVRNAYGQDIGLVDSLGGAWRRRPHAEDERLGSGTVEAGVKRILEVGPDARLEAAADPRTAARMDA